MMFNNPNPQFPQGQQQMPFGQNPMFQQYGQVQQPKMTQTLTPEQINRLRSSGGGFSLQIPETEMLQALCTHKYGNNFDMMQNEDGSVTCKICGKTFNLLKREKSEVTDAVNVINDFLQSTKTMYLDIPEETAKAYFQIIPLINRLPELYKLAVDDFNKFNGGGDLYAQNSNSYGFNALANLMSPTSAMGMPMNQFGSPMMGGYPGQQMGQPMGYPQQMPMQGGYPGQQMPMNPQMGQPQGNPFGYYGAPQQMPMQGGYPGQPMGQPMGYPQQMPMQGQPMQGQQMNQQPAPSAPESAPVVQQTKQMSV